MTPLLRLRLGGLMFLQYFMMGVWFVPFGSYMSKGLDFDHVIGFAYGSQGIATIVSALAIGTLADRVFPAQKLLAALFLLSGLTLLALSLEGHGVGAFLTITFLHFLFFIPTIPLANSICFHWLPDPAAQFPRIRALGTTGWIVSGLAVGSIAGAAESRLPLVIGAASGILVSFYALTLPHTPPRQQESGGGVAAIFGLDVLRKQADRPFWVLIWATLMIMLPMAFYYAYCNNFLTEAGAAMTVAGRRLEATAIQSLGQVSELLFMLLLPFFLRVFGIRGVFMLGLASWVLRYVLFAAGFDGTRTTLWMLLSGVLLHGAANDFIQVAGQVYVDQSFTAEAKARAQALFTTVLMGVGAVVGSVIANFIYGAFSSSPLQREWTTIWLIPAGAALVTLVWFWFSFHPRRDLAPAMARSE